MFDELNYESIELTDLSLESVFFDSEKNFAGMLFFDKAGGEYIRLGNHKIDQQYTEVFSG